jgi:hypothetical protein
MSVEMVLRQTAKIQELMRDALQKDVHFGVIPGTGTKPTLLKPGAEKLCLMFRFAPEYHHVKDREPDGHLTIESTCRLIHSPSGTLVATGSGICSTHESKYAYRKAQRVCPRCGVAAIFKDKKSSGYYCWAKRDGCGAQFASRDEIASIESQETGRIPNEDLADQWNTIIKMADKRSLIAALLNGTAASDIFNQDLEEIRENLESRTPTTGPVATNEEVLQERGLGPKPPSADAPASKAQKKALGQAILAKFKSDNFLAKAWLDPQLEELGCTRENMRIDQLEMLIERIANWHPTPINDPPDPALFPNEKMADKDIEF